MSNKLIIRSLLSRPIEWLNDETWTYLADYSDSQEYSELDEIWRYFDDDFPREDLSEHLFRMTDDELRADYKTRFPKMLGKALAELGNDIQKGEVFDFVIEDL